MYNEFANNTTKGKWPCTTNSLYNKSKLISRLNEYFSIYFQSYSAPTAQTLFLFVLSMLALEAAHSIRFLYRHFLTGITEKSLNTFDYVCSYANVDSSSFLTTTASIALRLIPSFLDSYPVFFCVDDTMVPKAGKKFEQISILYDHAAHNGNSYLNGSQCEQVKWLFYCPTGSPNILNRISHIISIFKNTLILNQSSIHHVCCIYPSYNPVLFQMLYKAIQITKWYFNFVNFLFFLASLK